MFFEKGSIMSNDKTDQQEQVKATELFERNPRFKNLEEIIAALQEGIYGE